MVGPNHAYAIGFYIGSVLRYGRFNRNFVLELRE